jgi:hypothetical protein
MVSDDLCDDDVAQIVLRIEGVELDQRGDDGPVLAAIIGNGEQCVLAVQRDWPDRAFDDSADDVDTTLLNEAGRTLPT